MNFILHAEHVFLGGKSMELEDKIDSISEANIVAELSTMLDKAHVSTSWWGQRLVSIDGYEGEVKIDKLAKKYLEAVSYQRDHDTSLQSRLDYANLRDRVKKLYIDSDTQLNETLIYWIIVPLLEYRPWDKEYYIGPQAIIRNDQNGKFAEGEEFAFSPERFKQYWNAEMRTRASFEENYSEGTVDVKWYASKEMVESALAVQR